MKYVFIIVSGVAMCLCPCRYLRAVFDSGDKALIDSRLSISVAVGSIQVIRPVRDQLDKAFAQA